MITVIFGKPGHGKTAYLSSIGLKYLGCTAEASELKQNSIEQIRFLNSRGFNYSMPDRPPVYTNYPLSAQIGYKKRRDSYYVDGFHLGLENDFVPVIPVVPGSKILMTEVQRYYNSRVPAKDFSDWVSRYFEEHRQFSLDIYLDLQRLGLLDLNVRDICEDIVEVVDVEHKIDYAGNVLESEFLLRKWSSLSAAEAFISNNSLKNYDLVKERFTGNVFESYKSKQFFDAFLPKKDFMFLEHVGEIIDDNDLSFVKAVYRQTAPYGFYKSEAAQILKDRIKAEQESKRKKTV